MRYLMMVKASGFTEAGIGTGRDYAAKLLSYRNDLKQAGVLLAYEELQPSSAGLRVDYPTGGGEAEVWPGPFSIDQGLIAGFTLIDVDTEEEALQWALRMPVPAGQGAYGIELRRLEDRLVQSHNPRQAAMELDLKNYLQL
ncbi:YciI family protein [Paenibacillus sp. JDR-2]|uniref:YciI family protein n=1 Tax=Paenibacillus sp. (strain JDR-2) TaxID=324057 RepID=UPI00016647D4|nr:YciI family protein [Paenibacillus sp. JDR-2]ACT04132.1 YCII-related [Paenibacillus sp. JDR-2]